MGYSVAVILPAAGSGVRMGADIPKAFIPVSGKPILIHTIRRFAKIDDVKHVIVAVPPGMEEHTRRLLDEHGFQDVTCVEGGSERLYSIHNALEHTGEVDLIAVHDAVRPFVPESDITNVFQKAAETGAAILAIPTANTLKKMSGSHEIEHTVDRSNIWQALTPQVFRKELLVRAYEHAIKNELFGTDDAYLVEQINHKISIVEGSTENIKLTYPEDLKRARMMFEATNLPFRTGIGYDVHRLKSGRKLMLGGVEVPHSEGLDGHSDADVLIHAIIDAITGALALGDIGSHFPDTDQAYKNIDSRVLLRKVMELVSKKGYEIGNVDATVVAEKPKLNPFIPEMRKKLATDLGCQPELVSVKATTSEKMGFVGRQEGMSALATVLMKAVR